MKPRKATRLAGKTALLGLAPILAMAGCATVQRGETPPASALAATPPGYLQPIRTDALNREFFETRASEATLAVKAASDGSIDILALSGGGAGGAYGAGVLTGLTKAGTRPKYEIVTGVSTGALIATFAFLGPEYDDKLTEAFRGKSTTNVLKSRGLGSLFSTSFYDGAPLKALIDKFITDEMIDRVGAESITGRMLLVATTNLDREETTLWNMTAIASKGGADAHNLYRKVLLASSSIPGVFPPVLIDVTAPDGKTYTEMHVDGGASRPFFVTPDIAMIIDFAPPALRGANLFVIVNGQASSPPRTTPFNMGEVMSRSFTTVLNHMARTQLGQTSDFAQRNGMTFKLSAIPSDVAFGGALAFDEPGMAAIFDYASRCAVEKRIWVTPLEALAHVEAAGADQLAPAQAQCPLLNTPGFAPK
ncbi:MAG TPA: patatin-like phospholipase family protein [Hyphomonadaceae bacterium]|nr:patatin-like phospholipase family protein [Hyphomonadaceae bacterium]